MYTKTRRQSFKKFNFSLINAPFPKNLSSLAGIKSKFLYISLRTDIKMYFLKECKSPTTFYDMTRFYNIIIILL